MITRSGSTIGRIRDRIRREGLFTLLLRKAYVTWGRMFRRRVTIWVWRKGQPFHLPPVDVEVVEYARRQDVPPQAVEELLERAGQRILEQMADEFAEGATLWVARVAGRVAGYQWSRRAVQVRGWHRRLSAPDVLMYGAVTFPEFRGHRVGPAIARRITEEVGDGGGLWVDTMIWNTPARKALQRTGFTCLSEEPPLANHPY